ncbi:MAG: glycosyltransferase [Halioglobus sp.]
MNQRASEATICVTPRERFSCAVDSLKDIARNTERPYQLVYIDANSPAHVATDLAAICAEHGFDYLRINEYLAPNQARNIALGRSSTRYVAFVDNDLFVQPGWLNALLRCAEDTGAWAVSPVVLEGGAALQIVHMAGGDLIEEPVGGYNRLQQKHRYMKLPLRSVRKKLTREAVGFFEFHCALVRTDVFSSRAFLDEGFLSHQEHIDLAREIRLSGGSVFFEPESVVRYDTARSFQPYDREFFELRWSDDWSDRSIEHARRKWQLAPDDAGLARLAYWTGIHRNLFNETQSRTPWIVKAVPRAARRMAATWLREHKLLKPRQLP